MNPDRLLMLSLFVLSTQVTNGYINPTDQTCVKSGNGGSFIGWADYIQQWKDEDPLMSQRMYPFGPTYCDIAERSLESVRIDGRILFYAVQYDSIIITIHGHISFFTPDRPPPPTNGEWQMPYPWPNQLYGLPRENDPAMAAIFYTTHAYLRKGILNYRSLQRTGNGDPLSRIKDGMLDYLSKDVQAAVIGAAEFTATYGLLVTWEKMTFSGVYCSAGEVTDDCPRNTYQMAIVTDDRDTYVIYNYYNVTWAGTTSMGCASNTGRPSDANPNCVGAQIGFNVGDGRYFWPHPYSLTTRVVDLDREDFKGSTVRGRFFYRVSDAFIQRGGCSNDVTIAGPKWPLVIGPTAGGMFGGYDMNISAPCFDGGERIQCKFGEMVVTEGQFKENPMMARCPVPMMSSVGRIDVGVSNDGGSNFRYSTYLTVGMQGYVPAGITVENTANDWLNVEKFVMRWNPKGISWRKVGYVDIKLFGYKESAQTGETRWVELHTLATNVVNDGYYTVYPSEHKCGGLDAEYNCVQYTVGLLGVEISGTNPGASPTALWSDPLPVGWFVKDEAPKHLGNNWIHEMCRLWHSEDLKLENWDRDLQVCPCTLSQAYHDWGRFAEDVSCNNRQGLTGNNCKRHTGAKHCVRSTVPTSSGAGAQCCYDDKGDLMYSGDTQYGSTPDKSHAWGSRPYGTSGKVPLMSHWYWDVAPFYACCEWQDNDYDCFNFYIDRRTTPSCQSYRSPAHAAAFGDPHIRTFDGATYTYNGRGEFILLHVDNVNIGGQDIRFMLQARYQRPKPQNWGTPKGTVITAVVMQTSLVGGKDGDVLEIQRNNYKPGDRRLLLYINKKLIDFRNPALWRQDFDDFVIFNNDPDESKFHTNFTIIFRDSMIGVQVAYKNGLMHVITVVPPELKGRTLGLFGIWDDNPGNDIKSRDGGNPVNADETERIHTNVGYSWQIKESESLFSYWAKVDWDYYKEDNTFKPVFVPTFPDNGTGGITEAQVRALCGNNLQCQFDYMVTLDRNIASDTLDIQAWMQQQRDESKTVKTCGWLDIPYSLKSGGRYYPGEEVVITGCRNGFKLEGPTSYRCVDEGASASWKPPITTRCVDQSDVKEAEVQMAVAIGVPAGIVFLLIIIGIVGLLCYLRQKRIDRGPKAPPGDDLEHIPVSNFHASDIRQEDILVDDKPAKKKKPRPGKRTDLLTPSRSHDDLSLYGSQRQYYNNNQNKAMSASADALDRDLSCSAHGSSIRDEPDLNTSLQSDASAAQRGPRPYNYPRNTETLGAERRRAAPYNYPRNTETNLTPEQRALIEERTRAFHGDT